MANNSTIPNKNSNYHRKVSQICFKGPIKQPKSIKIIPRVFILQVMLLSVLPRCVLGTVIQKITLNQFKESTYGVNVVIANSKVNLVAHLSDQLDWIKGNGCNVCNSNENTINSKQNKKQKAEDCQQSCFSEHEQGGISCVKSYCKILQKQQKIEATQLPYYIKQATKVEFSLKIKHLNTLIGKGSKQNDKQKSKSIYNTLLVDKMNEKLPQMGRINLLNGKKGFFGNQVLLVKNNAKDITAYFHNPQQSQSNQDQLSSISQLNLLNQTQAQLHKTPGITSLSITNEGTIRDTSSKSKNKNKNKNTNLKKQSEEDQQGQENEEQEQVNVFEAGWIIVKDRDKVADGSLAKDTNSGAVGSDILEIDQENDNPYFSSIKLDKTLASFSIKTNKLLLPPLIYKRFTKLIISKYFSELNQKEIQKQITEVQDKGKEQTSEQSQKSKIKKSQIEQKQKQKKCKFQANSLSCPYKHQLNLQKLDNITITLTLNNISIQFPIRSLIESCSKNSCRFSLQISKNKKQIIIGDFILSIFAMQFNKKLNRFTLYRLNNQWADPFLKTRMYKQGEVNFIIMFLYFIFRAIWFVLRLIFIAGGIVLGLNCLYHWREMLAWTANILSKLSNQDINNQQTTGTLSKVSGRIKDRLKNAIKKKIKKRFNKNSHSLMQASFQEEQLNGYVSKNPQEMSTKLVSVNQLPDRDSESSSGDEDQLRLNIEDQFNLDVDMKNTQIKQLEEKKSAIIDETQNFSQFFHKIDNKKQIKQKLEQKSEQKAQQIPKPAIYQTVTKQNKQKQKQHNQLKEKSNEQQKFYQFQINEFQNQFPEF